MRITALKITQFGILFLLLGCTTNSISRKISNTEPSRMQLPANLQKACFQLETMEAQEVCVTQSHLSHIMKILGHSWLIDWMNSNAPHDLVTKLIEYEEKRFQQEYALSAGPIESDTVVQKLYENANFIFFSDVHTQPQIQPRAASIFSHLVRSNRREKLFMAEWVDSNYQNVLDDFLTGKISVEEYRKASRFDTNFNRSWWPNYKPLLNSLKELYSEGNFKVLACLRPDANKVHIMDIESRDAHTAQLIQQNIAPNPDMQVFVLHGQSHILNGKIDNLLGNPPREKTITFFTHLSFIYWQQVNRIAETENRFVRINGRENSFYMNFVAPEDFHSETLGYFSNMLKGSNEEIYQKLIKTLRSNYKALHSSAKASDWEGLKTTSQLIVEDYQKIGAFLKTVSQDNSEIAKFTSYWSELENLQ